MQTLDDMRRLSLLTADQHAQISQWVARAKTPECILAMPEPLWRALSLASLLMNVDVDLVRPPNFSFDGPLP